MLCRFYHNEQLLGFRLKMISSDPLFHKQSCSGQAQQINKQILSLLKGRQWKVNNNIDCMLCEGKQEGGMPMNGREALSSTTVGTQATYPAFSDSKCPDCFPAGLRVPGAATASLFLPVSQTSTSRMCLVNTNS